MTKWTELYLYYGNYIATKNKNFFTRVEEKKNFILV